MVGVKIVVLLCCFSDFAVTGDGTWRLEARIDDVTVKRLRKTISVVERLSRGNVVSSLEDPQSKGRLLASSVLSFCYPKEPSKEEAGIQRRGEPAAIDFYNSHLNKRQKEAVAFLTDVNAPPAVGLHGPPGRRLTLFSRA